MGYVLWVSSSEQRLCRLAEQAAACGDPLRALEILVGRGSRLDAVTRSQAARGLRAGRSFGDLARVLGISRQAAHRRFRDLAPARTRLAATEQARRVLRVAGEEAVRAKAGAIGSDHVLIAVLRCGGEVGEMLLREGVTLAEARESARAIAADGGRALDRDGPTTGPRDLRREAAQASILRGNAGSTSSPC